MDKPVYLLLHERSVFPSVVYVYERLEDHDNLVWTGILADLNEDEYPISGEIFEEDINL